MIHRNLLKKVKKANKARRLKLAVENGFYSVEEFIAHLEANLEPEEVKGVKETKEKLIIHNVTLLDATTSMSWANKYDNSKKGIISEIENFVSNEEYTVKHTLIEFIDSYSSLHIHFRNKEKNCIFNFVGATGNNTPLWRFTEGVIKMFKDVPKNEKVLIKIYTDGENNTQHSYANTCSELIKEVQKENFTVTFVGIHKDMEKIIDTLHLDKSNTLAIENTGEGFKKAFEASYKATTNYATRAAKGEDVSTGFYLEIL
jgi:hypothetical protein